MTMHLFTNRRARYDWHIEETFEAGLVLEGWEVKALRQHKATFSAPHVVLREGAAYLIGLDVSAPDGMSTHSVHEPARSKKLLLHKHQIHTIIGAKSLKGLGVVALDLYFKRGHVKCSIALARGKKQHDKRNDIAKREQTRQIERAMKNSMAKKT